MEEREEYGIELCNRNIPCWIFNMAGLMQYDRVQTIFALGSLNIK